MKSYSIEVKVNKKLIVYHSVNDLIRFYKFLDTEFVEGKRGKWNFTNVYNAEEFKLYERMKKEGKISSKPAPLISYLNGENPTRPLSKWEA